MNWPDSHDFVRLGDQSDCYQALGRQDKPVLVLRGVEDVMVTAKQTEAIRDMVPRASYIEIGGTAHAFLLTHPEKVAPVLVDFFRRASD